MHLLFLSKYLAYAFICGNFMHDGDGRALLSYIYPTKHLYEPLLPNDSLLNSTILLISTLLNLIDFSCI